MASILRYEWDFGNGDDSNRATPVSTYLPGIYTVTLKVVILNDAGNEQILTTTEERYIRVSESNMSLLDKDCYVTTANKLSLHFGWNDSHGKGWSLNSGSAFVWPESNAAITEYEENGILYQLAWDMFDDKQYIINTRNCEVMDASYTDKAGDGSTYKSPSAGTDIATTIKLPEHEAQIPDHEMVHLETTVQFRPEITYSALEGTFDVDFTLITDEGQTEVEIVREADINREIVFFYQNNRTQTDKTNQIKIATNESKYQLLGYQTHFKRVENFDLPKTDFSDGDGSISDVMKQLGSPDYWVTRSGYGTNIGSDSTFSGLTDFSTTTGPEGLSYSAALLSANNTVSLNGKTGTILMWYKTAAPVMSDSVTLLGTSGSWTCTFYTGTFSSDVVFQSGGSVFDVRYIDGATLTSDDLQLYYDKYIEFLPRA